MNVQIVATYCLCDDLLRAQRHREDPQCQMSDAEVMTTALVAVHWFGGNVEVARLFLKDQGYIPQMLSKSRLNRRLHRTKDQFLRLFALVGEHWKDLNRESVYVIDSFPIASCDNIRIRRSRRYRGEAYRGYCASKKRYFYGLRLHLMVTKDGHPVEVFLTPGADNDVGCLDLYDFDVPQGARIIGDKAFNDYEMEAVLAAAGIHLCPLRKRNSKRPLPAWETFLRQTHRKVIETVGSSIERRFPKTIQAVTQQGFELKIILFVLAQSLAAL